MTTDSMSGNIDKSVLKRFGTYFIPHRTVIIIALILMVLVGAADSSFALAAKLLMDLFTGISHSVSSGEGIGVRLHPEFGGFQLFDYNINSVNSAWNLMIILAGASLCIVIVRGAMHFIKEYMMWGVTYRILMKLKGELFHRIVRLPLSYFDREKSGEVLSRVTYDVTQIEASIRSAIVVVKSVIYGLIFITAMFLMEWSLTLFVIAVFPISAILIKLFGDRMRRVSGDVSRNVADYTAFLGEAMGGSKIIKAFGREEDQEASFETKIRENYIFNMKITKLATLHSPTQQIFATLGMIGVVLFCGYRLISGGMTVGDLTGFLILLTYAYQPIKTVGEVNVVLQKALASGKRIFDLLDQPDEGLIIGSGSLKPDTVRGEIEFRDVSFSYFDGHEVLNGINLKIKAGETVALVGPSGGGKSTIVSLIPRFYPLHDGCIALDGINTVDIDLEYLRGQIAIVPQETILFSGTIEENILLGRPEATHEEVIAAAEAANAHQFINGLSDGYKSQVGERGVQLSGGQRQRIAVARAILRDPRILLLDEATSALDSESERLIQEALDRFRKDRTTVIIAHRLSTVQSADRIAVIDGGNIVELGTHSELYNNGGLYRKLCDQQFAV